MKNTIKSKVSLIRNEDFNNEDNLPGYPIYPENEDIYKQGKEEVEINPEDISNLKENEITGKANTKDFDEVLTGEDLDVPGSELDDLEEEIGSEDEENNYYSIGGDNHENLDEDLETI